MLRPRRSLTPVVRFSKNAKNQTSAESLWSTLNYETDRFGLLGRGRSGASGAFRGQRGGQAWRLWIGMISCGVGVLAMTNTPEEIRGRPHALTGTQRFIKATWKDLTHPDRAALQKELDNYQAKASSEEERLEQLRTVVLYRTRVSTDDYIFTVWAVNGSMLDLLSGIVVAISFA
ncbi:hypothetical protein NDN08_003604 [Rhodosorus marinus]|uniref:Uncharacterized protein n=1 Tax=Rhodosorus marinus TaxID=101924 RepID=A0AAV8V1R2_9RHOD|nr:hypothetical protein NDN08_003604 [Rhodosorus marinus]